jgi:hypothetical protein
MAHDRLDGDEVPLTHEFLAVMLGVRRSGVTTALQELERKGLIAHRRSLITILDREGLEESCNGAYTPRMTNRTVIFRPTSRLSGDQRIPNLHSVKHADEHCRRRVFPCSKRTAPRGSSSTDVKGSDAAQPRKEIFAS